MKEKGKNCRDMSQETLDSNIKRLLEINEKRARGSKSKFSLNDLNLYKLQCVERVNGVNFLVRKYKFGNSTGKRFVSIENMFSVIHEKLTNLRKECTLTVYSSLRRRWLY